MEDLKLTIPVAHDEDIKMLLTELRLELNLLNTLNCNVHKYQGDFSVGRELAETRTRAADALYLAQLQTHVEPLFAKLGRLLVKKRMITAGGYPDRLVEDDEFALLARRWYQEHYLTGIMW